MRASQSPALSVLVCTRDRAAYLELALGSLVAQTLPQADFEVVIVDDGSQDRTPEVARRFQEILPLRYFRQRGAGLGSARNHAIYAARGELLLFFDDDDMATPTLLAQHLETHRRYPWQSFAVLHRTIWAPHLVVTPLMHYVTEIGCYLFSYPTMRHGEILDFTRFWGGRTSCKRELLIEHGVFDPVFKFGCEDIELGYRLSRHGLRVVYDARAVAMMARPVDYHGILQRLLRQGRSELVLSRKHPDHVVQRWAGVANAQSRWRELAASYDAQVQRVGLLDTFAANAARYGLPVEDALLRQLYDGYAWVLKATKLKGLIEDRQPSISQDSLR